MSQMQREIYVVTKQPVDQVYHELIQYGQKVCDTALVVVRPSLGLEPSAVALLDHLEQFLMKKQEQAEWPGTELFGREKATVYYFHLKPECAKLLVGAVDGLYKWLQPERPEDLCLLRSDGTAWLTCIAHEKDAYFELTTEELETLLKAVPGIDLLRQK